MVAPTHDVAKGQLIATIPVGRYCVENDRGWLDAVFETSAPASEDELPPMTHVVSAHETALGLATCENDGMGANDVLPAAVAASCPGDVTALLVTIQQT